MPNPDVTPYYDLTLFDLDAQSVYQRALEYARVALPEFDPREGTIETVLLQSIAIEVAELATTINRLPSGIIQVLLNLLGIERSEGTLATTTVRFTGTDTNTRTVPAGVRLYYQPEDINDSLLIATDEDLLLSQSRGITSLDRDANDIVTATTALRHGLSEGDEITISGCSDETFNGVYEVETVVDQYTFTYESVAGADGEPSQFGTPVVIVDDLAYGIVSATALTPTDAFNDLGVGMPFQILSVVPAVSSAILASPITGGSNVENDSDFFARAVGTLQRLSSALVTPDHFVNYVSTNPDFAEIYRVAAVDETDYERVADQAGNLLVVVAPIKASESNLISGTDGGSAALGDPDFGTKDALVLDLQRRAHAGLTVHVVDPLIVTVRVDVTFTPAAGISYVEAGTAVKAALTEYLNPDNWNWSNTIYANELINVARNATYSSSDVELPAVLRVQSIAVTPTAVVADTITPRLGGTYTRPVVGDQSIIETTPSHNVDIDPGVDYWVAIKPANTSTWLIRKALGSTATNRFSLDRSEEGSGDWLYIGSGADLGAGDFVIHDPAPLVNSAQHQTNLAT